jgi:hypothetical protein
MEDTGSLATQPFQHIVREDSSLGNCLSLSRPYYKLIAFLIGILFPCRSICGRKLIKHRFEPICVGEKDKQSFRPASLPSQILSMLERVATRLEDNKWGARQAALEALAGQSVLKSALTPEISEKVAARLTDDKKDV